MVTLSNIIMYEIGYKFKLQFKAWGLFFLSGTTPFPFTVIPLCTVKAQMFSHLQDIAAFHHPGTVFGHHQGYKRNTGGGEQSLGFFQKFA